MNMNIYAPERFLDLSLGLLNENIKPKVSIIVSKIDCIISNDFLIKVQIFGSLIGSDEVSLSNSSGRPDQAGPGLGRELVFNDINLYSTNLARPNISSKRRKAVK